MICSLGITYQIGFAFCKRNWIMHPSYEILNGGSDIAVYSLTAYLMYSYIDICDQIGKQVVAVVLVIWPYSYLFLTSNMESCVFPMSSDTGEFYVTPLVKARK